MKRVILVGLWVLGLVALPSKASADVIAIDDYIRMTSSTGSLGGGAFSLDNLSNGAGVDFLTFCLQRSQYIDYSTTFRVGGISNAADDLPLSDPISDETAWLYSNFRRGVLPTVYSADAIQAAIWYFEDEWTTDVGNSASLRLLAHNAVTSGWTNDGVHVLNLFYADGRRAQDQLTYTPTVPEPVTLALLGTGLFGLARLRRRRRGRSASLPAED